jgi:hypothetical protein
MNKTMLSAQAIAWLANGERGTSSNTIFTHLSGMDCVGRWGGSHPLDPGDFRRCRLLLDQVPEFQARINELRTISPVWDRLVSSWMLLCDTMDAEFSTWREAGRGSCPKTFKFMQELGC